MSDSSEAERVGRGLLTPPRSAMWLGLQAFARPLFSTLFDCQAYGVENLPRAGGVILAANHQSYLDPPLVAAPLHRAVSFMAKSELFENPYFGWFIRALHAFPIKQGRGDRGAIVETVRRLQEGNVVNIYPEGSRTLDGRMSALQPGVALVIRKAEVPVVPVAIDGSYEAWPRTRKLFRPGLIKVAYGPALKLWEVPGAEAVGVLEKVMREMVAELAEWPAGAAGEPRTTVVSPAPRELLYRE